MLTSQKIIDAINEQIGNEFGAMLQYFAIAAHFDAETLPGLSEHFSKQAEEGNLLALHPTVKPVALIAEVRSGGPRIGRTNIERQMPHVVGIIASPVQVLLPAIAPI